jgi:chemotaxis signal transduction protein
MTTPQAPAATQSPPLHPKRLSRWMVSRWFGNVVSVSDVSSRSIPHHWPSRPEWRQQDDFAPYEHRIVVADVVGQDIGMVVVTVTEVSCISEASIEPPSTVITTDDSDYLTGIVKAEQKLIILLDIAKVISADESGQRSQAVDEAEAA